MLFEAMMKDKGEKIAFYVKKSLLCLFPVHVLLPALLMKRVEQTH